MKKKMPKNKMQEIKKRISRNLIVGVLVIIYFMVLQLAHSKMKEERLIGDIQVFSGTFLVIGIVFLEQAFRHDEGYRAINGIEAIILSAHTLSINHVLTVLNIEFMTYMIISSVVAGIYYLLKSLMVFTLGKKQYIESFNDIAEIVKDEPQKKEATKRKKTTPTKKDKNISNKKEENRGKVNDKKHDRVWKRKR